MNFFRDQSMSRCLSSEHLLIVMKAQSNMLTCFCSRSLSRKQAELTMIEWALEVGSVRVVFILGFKACFWCASCLFYDKKLEVSGFGPV